jgi:cholest-4-en-3-one 26-monooxygenase
MLEAQEGADAMAGTPATDAGYPDLLDQDALVEHGYPWEGWRRLRAEAPVAWMPNPKGLCPYWAITRAADIVEISRQPQLFESGRPMQLEAQNQAFRGGGLPPTLLDLNPPLHGALRQIVSRRFTSRGLERIRRDVEQIALQVLDAAATGDARVEMDFVEKLAAPIPIAVIGWLLGVPAPDWPRLFDWTNRSVGANDPEYQRPGEDRHQTARQAQREIFEYFTWLSEQRRGEPRDDLISALVHAQIDGRPLTRPEVLVYCLVLVAAGNETTRNATSGGMLAFIEHPDQWERLRREPARLDSAVEEILRWTSPVIHFARRATADYELRGQKIRAGERVGLFYPSANRDEAVFDDPEVFRIDRQPNRHLAFGVGEHFCLGAHVARLELEVIFRHLARRLQDVELAGPPQRLRSAVVGGLKHVPIRCRLARA